MDWLIELPNPLRVVIIITTEIGIIALVLFVLQKFGVNITSGLPKAAFLQGLKNAFYTILIMSSVTGGIAAIPIFGFGQSVKSGFIISFGIIWATTFFWFLFNWFSHKRKAGYVLLDVISLPNKSLFFVIGVLAIVLGFSGYFDFIWEGIKYSWLISISIGLSVGISAIIMGFSRIQIHENGILAYVDLIKWNKIESVEWVYDNEKAYTIKFRYKGRMPAALRNGAIPVPVDKKEKLESLLAQYLPEIELLQNRA